MINFYRVKRNAILKFAKYIGNTLGSYLPPFPSVSAIIIKGTKILVVKLTYREGYSLPGGMLNNKETFEDGLCREVKEETGLTISDVSYFNSYSFDIEYPTINVVFTTKAKGLLSSSKEGSPEWVEISTILPKLIYADNKSAVKDFLKKYG